MANTLKIPVENADELLLAGVYGAGALIRIQSSTTEDGSFANLTGTGSTPTIALVAGTFIAVNFLVDLAFAWIDPRIRYR